MKQFLARHVRSLALVLGLSILPLTAFGANVFYTAWKASLLTAANDLSSVTVRIVLIDSADYTVSAAHDFLDDVPAGARVCTPQTLGTKTTTNGVFSSAAATFTSCSGDQAEAYLLYIDTGVESTSRIVGYFDTAASGLPVTPNGGNITITPHASNGWFFF